MSPVDVKSENPNRPLLIILMNRFFCAAVAALTLRAFNPYGNGKLVLLEVNYTQNYHSNSIYLIALVLGILGVSFEHTVYLAPVTDFSFVAGCLWWFVEHGQHGLDKACTSQELDEGTPDTRSRHGQRCDDTDLTSECLDSNWRSRMGFKCELFKVTVVFRSGAKC